MRALRYIPSLLWTAVIIWLLTKDSSDLPSIWWLEFPHSDKLIHAGLFAVGGTLIAFALRGADAIHLWMTVLLWAFVLGGFTEYVQHCCIAGRAGEWADLAADVLGAMLALSLFQMVQHRFR